MSRCRPVRISFPQLRSKHASTLFVMTSNAVSSSTTPPSASLPLLQQRKQRTSKTQRNTAKDRPLATNRWQCVDRCGSAVVVFRFAARRVLAEQCTHSTKNVKINGTIHHNVQSSHRTWQRTNTRLVRLVRGRAIERRDTEQRRRSTRHLGLVVRRQSEQRCRSVDGRVM
jgi:hypothetical protein